MRTFSEVVLLSGDGNQRSGGAATTGRRRTLIDRGRAAVSRLAARFTRR